MKIGDGGDQLLRDGVYEVSPTCVVKALEGEAFENEEEINEFEKKYPGCVVASAYETNSTIILSERPKRWEGVRVGASLRYGANTLFEGAPPRLLVIMEND